MNFDIEAIIVLPFGGYAGCEDRSLACDRPRDWLELYQSHLPSQLFADFVNDSLLLLYLPEKPFLFCISLHLVHLGYVPDKLTPYEIPNNFEVINFIAVEHEHRFFCIY